MTGSLKVAVVGAGVMGSNHIRVIQRMNDVKLVAIVEQNLDSARATEFSPDVEIARTVSDVKSDFDCAIIAVPTKFHLAVAREVANRGASFLVEKPLAPSVREAEELVALANDKGLTLAVGHIERFNPAIFELPNFIDNPIHFEASRISPYTPRIGDGVIFDLMIHDLDIVTSLLPAGATPTDVTGVKKSVHGKSEDLAVVTISFSSGQSAVFNTSRIGQSKIRTLEITQLDSSIAVDLLRQDLTVTKLSSHEFVSNAGQVRHQQTNVVETPFLQTRGEPLALELADFFDSIKQSRKPTVDGVAGTQAVQLAQRAVDEAKNLL